MKFEIFKKTGELRDRQGDWDGDEGDEEEIEISDKEVRKALSEIIFGAYFQASLPYIEHSNDTNVARMKKDIVRLISDCALEETLQECFADELQIWAQEEYGNAE